MKKRNILVLAVSVMVSSFALSKIDDTNRKERLAEKIVYERWDIAPQSTNSEIHDEIESADTEEIHIQLLLDYGEDFVPINDPTDDESTHEDVDAYLLELRNGGKQFHHSRNQMIYETLNLDEDNVEDVYISEYTPFIELTINEDIFFEDEMNFIYELVDNSYIACAYIGDIPELVPSGFAGQMSDTNFTATYQSNLDCSDVTVGIYEVGVVKKNHVNLAGTNIVVRNEFLYFETETDHATQMASIIGGNTGVSKGCTILSAEAYSTPNAKMDWFINKGANIINMSYGETNPSGKYSSTSAYMDYVVQNYKIVIVAAAGNFGNNGGKVGNPGLGYNVITAGACDIFAEMMADFSSYAEVIGPRKPTLVAPGIGYFIPNYSSPVTGTSLSSALVTGELTSLLQLHPAYKTNPARVIALTAANTRIMLCQGSRDNTGMDNFVGAGMMDFGNMRNYVSTGNIFQNTSPHIGQISYSGFNISAGETFRIAVSVLAKSLKTVSGTSYTNYDVIAVHTGTQVVMGQTGGDANLKIFEIVGTAATVGAVQLRLMQRNAIAIPDELICIYVQRIPASS